MNECIQAMAKEIAVITARMAATAGEMAGYTDQNQVAGTVYVVERDIKQLQALVNAVNAIHVRF